MSVRYATILKTDDGDEVVSAIASVEDGAPNRPDDKRKGAAVATMEVVPHGVKIGMIRGGPVNPSGDFGWPEGTPQWNW